MGALGALELKFSHGRSACGQLGAQLVAHQWPDLLHCVVACDLAANLGIEVFGAGACALARDRETIAQHQHTEGQELERSICTRGNALVFVCALVTLLGRELNLIDDICLDISRRHARGGLALGLNLLLDCLVAHGSLSETKKPPTR